MAFELLSKDYKAIEVTIAADASAGDIFTYNELRGFILTDVDVSVQPQAALIIEAEYVKCVKNAGEAWDEGEALYWDTIDLNVTNVAGTLDLIGYAAAPAISAAVIGYMFFDGRAEWVKT